MIATESLLKRTKTRCPVCRAECVGEVWKTGFGERQRVVMRRWCPEHGGAEVCLASDARFYWLAKGDPKNACCEGGACSAADDRVRGTLGRNANPGDAAGKMERLSTCLALIEIVNSCNLACPVCFADSPRSREVDAVPLSELQARIQNVIDRKGRIEILQLSGGEPTLHPQFNELLAWLHANPGIDYVLLNTNGVRMATDDAFFDDLSKTYRYGRFQLYLQFDGAQEETQHALRGADLRNVRTRVIERCAAVPIPVTLAMTVVPENLAYLWRAVEYGLNFSNVRGVAFQPMFQSGRVVLADAPVRLNTADIILAAVEQSEGRLRYEDFTPLPCGDPNCATVGYLLKVNGRTYSVSDFVDFGNVQGFLRDKVRYSLEDLLRCGCDSEPLGAMLKEFELNETNTFRLFIKPFMDAGTWDEDRIDRCCTHVIRPDGALDSFCRYYGS
jgi:uncharacterized radical SAM superfamily Fe-S cluster-containing enzyme